MPSLLNRQPKIDPQGLYIALTSAVTPGGPIRDGEKYRGDHPAVKSSRSSSHRWVRPGTRRGPRRLSPRHPGPQASGARRTSHSTRLLKPIPPERRVRATQTLYSGQTIAAFAGDIRDANDPFVRKQKQYFEPAGDGAIRRCRETRW